MTEAFDNPLTARQVGRVLNFRSPGIEEAIAREQRLGTTAIYNILCRRHVAYLADEVGMGKTYQALGVAALTWLMDPSAKILIITPRKAVQQKWHRDYRNFVSTNVTLADNRLKEPLLDRAVHPRCFCSNLIELGQEVCRDPSQLFMTRFSSYSWVARSLGVLDSGEVSTGGEVAEALHDNGLFVDVRDGARDAIFHGSTEQNVEVARQMAKLIPEFDLVIVDEAQKLRNKGGNIRTQVLNTLLGFYPWTEARDIEAEYGAPPRLLLLSATPAHGSEDDIYTQLSYASKEALRVKDRPWEDRQAYLDQVMVRRLRKLAGFSKYDYRRENPVVWERDTNSPERVVDELFLAYVQRELQSELERDDTTTQVEVGFLESFESYEPSELETDGDERSTHYEAEDDTVAPDHRVLAGIAEDFAQATGDDLPPHPKQRLVDQAARASFEADEPEKLLIFVRRLASVRELTHRICRVYDDVALRRLSNQIGPERIRSRVGPAYDFERFETPEQFRVYAEVVLGTDAKDVEVEAATSGGDDELVAESRVLSTLRHQTDQISPGEKLLRRLGPDESLAPVFEENLVRFLFRQLDDERVQVESYEAFCERVCDDRVRETFHQLLSEGRDYFFDGDGGGRFTRIRALLNELVLVRCEELWPDARVATELLRIHRDIHGAKHELADDPNPDERFPDYIDGFLEHRSFWDLARERDEDLEFVQLLRGHSVSDAEVGEWLEYREFIKRIFEKNVRVSEAVLHFFVAYDRAGGAQPQRLAEEFADILFGPEGRRTRYRIEELVEQGPALQKLAGGQLDDDQPLYAETRWSDFDRQQPALGAMGGTSSRYPVIVKFNAPFFPDFVVATDVFREGVDLHMSCNRVWHFGMVSNPGDIEQRSGRIDRYFSKVHRELQEQPGSEPTGSDSHLHIEYPYLARTIDEEQVARVLERKLEVQPLMDQGLSVTEEIRLNLQDRAETTARELLRELSDLTGDDTTPFPVEPHLERGTRSGALEPRPHPDSGQLLDWMASKLAELEGRVPLTQSIAKEFREASEPDRAFPALTNLAVVRRKGRSHLVDPKTEAGEFREQPVQFSLGFSAELRMHYLRLSSPMGDHAEPVPTVLQRTLHDAYADAPLRLHHNPGVSAQRRHWRIAVATDLLLPADVAEWPTLDRLHSRLTQLAEAADDLEWRLREMSQLRQDLTYEEVR